MVVELRGHASSVPFGHGCITTEAERFKLIFLDVGDLAAESATELFQESTQLVGPFGPTAVPVSSLDLGHKIRSDLGNIWDSQERNDAFLVVLPDVFEREVVLF
jgi:hypothetical protein